MGTPSHLTDHPSKNVIFLLFVRVRNDKNTTRCEICSVFGARAPRNRSPWTLAPLSNQGSWSTPPSTRPAPVGTPPPYRASFNPSNRQANPSLTPCPGIKALGLPPRPAPLETAPSLGPCPYHLSPPNRSLWTPPPSTLRQKYNTRCEICSSGSFGKHMTGRTCTSRGPEIGAEAAHVRAPLLKAGRCPSRIPRRIAWH